MERSFYTGHGRPSPSQRRQPAQVFPPLRMSPALDPLSIQFATHARVSKSDVLDLGCGTGIATVAALARGAHVIAIDPDAGALRELLARVPKPQYPRLRVRVGRLPELNFKLAHFSAVHVSRVLHVLDGDGLRQSFANFFRWLYPEGKLYISTLSPAGSFWGPFQAEYARRVAMRDPWPGFIECVSDYFPDWDCDSDPVHLLDGRVLRRELEAAGFVIEATNCERLAWDPEQACCEVIAHCGP